MKYIHILQVLLSNGGGVGSVVTDVCQEMARSGKNVQVLSLQRWDNVDLAQQEEWAKRYGIHAETMQKPGKSKWAGLLALRKYLAQVSANEECCLYMHLKWGVLAGILCSLGMKNIKRVEVYHSGYMRYKLQAFLSKPFIHRYMAVSQEAKEQLVHQFGVKADKIEVVYNGVDIATIREQAGEPRSSTQPMQFMSVGRLSFEKGFQNSIAAYAQLVKTNQLQETTYVMIGDGDLRSSCEQSADGTVRFMGLIPRSEVYRHINGCDVMVLPSWWEGNSILLLEVLALGKAMLVTDIPSFREVLDFSPLKETEQFRPERFGVVFRKEDEQSCQEAMLWISQHPDKLPAMAAFSRQLSDAFSLQDQAKRYVEVADRLFAQN